MSPPFFPARNLRWSRPIHEPPLHTSGAITPTGVRAAGLRYERYALRHLASLFPRTLIPKQWFAFRLAGENFVRHVELDAFCLDFRSGQITLFEVKLRHTPRAWAQLALLYEPIILKAFCPAGSPHLFATRYCEIVRWYDPHTECPVPPVLARDLLALRPNTFNVHILS